MVRGAGQRRGRRLVRQAGVAIIGCKVVGREDNPIAAAAGFLPSSVRDIEDVIAIGVQYGFVITWQKEMPGKKDEGCTRDKTRSFAVSAVQAEAQALRPDPNGIVVGTLHAACNARTGTGFRTDAVVGCRSGLRSVRLLARSASLLCSPRLPGDLDFAPRPARRLRNIAGQRARRRAGGTRGRRN